jgi:CRISPR-associated protein Csd2
MNNRYDFIYLFDCADANPNGDPDAGNMPRLDPETGQGLATDVMLKRKIRNFIQTTKTEPTLQIFVQEKRPLNPLIAQACSESGLETFKKGDGKWDTDKAKKRPQSEIKTIQQWMCNRYFDIRAFGGVLSTGPNGGQIRGPVQISFSRSIDRIVTAEHTITRLTDVDAEEGEMGRKYTIPYGLYKCQGFVNPYLAAQTGFTGEGEHSDLELLFTALENAFQFDQSASRPAGSVNPRALLVFKHDTALGAAASHKLFDLVTIIKKPEVEVARSFIDYVVTIDEAAIPKGVTLIRRI